jgi:XTP/dITP diphosphohydrolase
VALNAISTRTIAINYLVDSMKIVLASGNTGKIRELQNRLGEQFELLSQNDLGVIAPPEDGLSFVENAIIKARAACKQTGLPALADDSGLSVDALEGAPGIYSARFSGDHATDESNNQLLLEKLAEVENTSRTARFQCALVYMRNASDPTPIICQGTWEGHILHEPQGTNGFGYDPLFFAFDQGCASAQLPPEIKNQVSHRGKAINLLIESLQDIDKNTGEFNR